MKKIDLSRLHPTFRRLVLEYMRRSGLKQGQIASLVGMQRSHFNALLNGSSDRPLTAYYLLKFIRKGIVKVKDIKDGNAKNEREVEFWESAGEAENIATLQLIAKLRKRGIDVDQLLKSALPKDQ
jgi:hypothetical protein